MSTQPTRHLFSEMEKRTKLTGEFDRLLCANVATVSKQIIIRQDDALKIVFAGVDFSNREQFYEALYTLGTMLRYWCWEFDNAFTWVVQTYVPSEFRNNETFNRIVAELVRGLDDSLKADELPTTLEATA